MLHYNISGWEVMKSAFTNELLPDPLDVKTEEAVDAAVDMVRQNNCLQYHLCGSIP